MKNFLLLLLGALLSVNVSFASEDKTNYANWLQNLQAEMIKRGISEDLLKSIYSEDYYEKEPEVFKRDIKQAKTVTTSSEYLNRIITPSRVKDARERYAGFSPVYQEIAKKYGVSLPYLTAFWSVESSFGNNKGRHNWIKCLTQLAYRSRRTKFFRNELFYALKIIQDNKLDYADVTSSWDGGVGNFQFMPSTYEHFAVDYNGNGKADLWNELEDAFASAANYLIAAGWQAGKPWGAKAQLPWDFDYAQIGKKHKKTVSEWRALGVDFNLPAKTDNDQAYIILPEGSRGQAYIVLKNFDVITRWNHSTNYALSVGYLADYIASETKWKEVETSAYKPDFDSVLLIQRFYNKNFKGHVAEDGKLGPKTKEAVQEMQKRYKLPQDGYPDWRLVQIVSQNQRTYIAPLPPKKSKH